ncbi:class I SAM-dependent methyltransferase [uncultured Brachyspira sp.]|uniref:class I SAM-dependent methyltransferase n=1 Tax=uncultured Brachyspira sp. TaxID=221953 RepID=UPI0025F906CC|nr:class I SAM-dependent methyltransferase [uncultured Brachyspira sp.]
MKKGKKSEIKKLRVKTHKNLLLVKNDSEEDKKKLEIIRDILINDENKDKADLHNYFLNNKGEAIFKHLPFFDIYERHFSKYRGKDINMMEIGVGSGGAVKMWREYFKNNNSKANVNIYAIDKNPKCLQFEENNIKIFIGSQDDRDFLKEVKKQIPKLDILIDDGGHKMNQQIITFEEMYEHIKDDGIYLCEDVYTSYWANFGGGYKNPNSYIEYTKNLIDSLNAYWAAEEDDLYPNNFTDSTYSIHYYDAVVVIEKKKRDTRYNDICQQAIIGKTKE